MTKERANDIFERAERVLDWIYISGDGTYTLSRCNILDYSIAAKLDEEYDLNVEAARLLARRGEVTLVEGFNRVHISLKAPCRRTA